MSVFRSSHGWVELAKTAMYCCMVAILGGTVPNCLLNAQEPLHTIAAVRALTEMQAAEARAVDLVATVTFYDPQQQFLFIQDSTQAIYVESPSRHSLASGDRIEVRGTTAPGYTSQVEATDIRLIAHGKLTAAPSVSYRIASLHKNDCGFVTMQGVVRVATLQSAVNTRAYMLEVEVDHHMIEVAISRFPGFDPQGLLDATVRVSGNLSGNYDALQHIVSLQLLLEDASRLKIVRLPIGKLSALPLTPLTDLLRSDQALTGNKRVRTSGILALYDPGERMVIQDRGSYLLVQTRQMDSMVIGREMEVTGFPAPINGSPGLENAQAFATKRTGHLLAQPTTFAEALSGNHANELVSMVGELVSETRESHLDTLTLRAGDEVFEAVFRKSRGDADPIPVIEPGTRLRVSGICLVHVRGVWGAVESFQIHLRSERDIAVLAPAPWWTVRHMFELTLILMAVLLVALGWGILVRRRLSSQEKIVRQKIETEAARLEVLAHFEKQRSWILELINSFEPLQVVFEAIHKHTADMWPAVRSYSHAMDRRRLLYLSGSEVKTGRISLMEPVDPLQSSEACAEAVRTRSLVHRGEPASVWSRPLISSNGEVIGAMTFEAIAGMAAEYNQQAFDFACSLAAIAIDNRRLYEDALHRSRHDQLTGLANRAVLDEKIEASLEEARQTGCQFSVLFLDLDNFKPINDRYSHRLGDMYLCEVVHRFQACLRECDTLCRIGGDEFVVVIPRLPDIEVAMTVAQRLLLAVHDPVLAEGIPLLASTSIGLAMYPASGTSAAQLKHNADAAMYEAKRSGGDRIAVAPMENASDLWPKVATRLFKHV